MSLALAQDHRRHCRRGAASSSRAMARVQKLCGVSCGAKPGALVPPSKGPRDPIPRKRRRACFCRVLLSLLIRCVGDTFTLLDSRNPSHALLTPHLVSPRSCPVAPAAHFLAPSHATAAANSARLQQPHAHHTWTDRQPPVPR